MAEPTSTSSFSIAALSIALLGPLAGPFALIVFAALSGALWAVAASTESSRLAGAWMLVRCTLLAVIITGGLSAWIQSMYDIPALELLAPVAFVSAAMGNKWQTIFASLVDAIQTAMARFFKQSNGADKHE
jgi:hypothetical protein